jgi:tetratricopeptide (TPR) repeat protein
MIAATCLTAGSAFGQIQMPRPSPGATITQDVGLGEVTVVYSRPGMKDRVIFGELVPYGEVWRTGANASTKITFTDDANFGGMDVPAGEYALLTVPGKDNWTIILSSDLESNIGGYDEANDLGRIQVPANMIKTTFETFTIEFSNLSDNGAHLDLIWENTHVAVPITVDTDSKVMAMIEEQLIKGDGEGLKAGDYANAADFYHKKGENLEQAVEWMDKAVSMAPEAFWYMHRYARLLADAGMKEEAIKMAQKSMELAQNNEGGDYGYVERNKELLKELGM